MATAPPQPADVSPPAWWEPGRDPRPLRARELIGWCALLVWLLVSRWTVAPDLLLEWDSANYALGLRDFDIFQHQPHPPGYPVYTLLLKGLALLGSSETWPFLAANSLLGGATLVLMGWMVRRTVGGAAALCTAAAFCACPPFWFHGAASTAYVAECFCSVGCMALALALVRRRLGPELAALAFAVILGLRPSGVVSFSPVIVLACALSWPGWRRAAVALGVFCGGCALWFVPLVALGGGWERYREATVALYQWQRYTSDMVSSQWTAAALLRYLLDGVNLLWLALAANLALVALAQRRRSRRTAALVVAWFLPATSVYVFHHLAKSAYALTLVPVVFVAGALALGSALPGLSRRWRIAALATNGVLVAAFLALNVYAFYSAVPRLLFKFEDAEIELPRRVLLLGDYGRLGLRYRTYGQRQVRSILDRLDPRKDLALFALGTLEQHRLATFHHPRQWTAATSLDHRLVLHSPPGPRDMDFGTFQMGVLGPARYRPPKQRAACLHATGGRLLLSRGSNELEIALPRGPRRLVVFFAAPAHRLWRGVGMVPKRWHHVGAGVMAWELDPVGLREERSPRLTPMQRWHQCRRPGRQSLRNAQKKIE